MCKNHYEYLEKHLAAFFERVGINPKMAKGMAVAHGDKVDGYKKRWEDSGLHFYHGVAIYMLGHYGKFAEECRQTKRGWVDPWKWVVINKNRFLPFLDPVEEDEENEV